MTVQELKEILDKVEDENAEVQVCAEHGLNTLIFRIVDVHIVRPDKVFIDASNQRTV